MDTCGGDVHYGGSNIRSGDVGREFSRIGPLFLPGADPVSSESDEDSQKNLLAPIKAAEADPGYRGPTLSRE